MSLNVRIQTTHHFDLTVSKDELREVINNFLVQKFFEARKAAGVPREGPDFSKKVKMEIEERAKILMDEGLTAAELEGSSSFCLTFSIDGTYCR